MIPSAAYISHSRKLWFSRGLSQNTWFLWAVETYPYHSRTQILGLAGVLGPKLFSGDTKLAGSAGLSVLFLLGSEGIVPDCWRTLIHYGPLEIIIYLHSWMWSGSCSVSLSLGEHQKPEVAAQSYFHCLLPSVAWYLLMQQHLLLGVNKVELYFCFQTCMQILSVWLTL